MNKEQEKFQKNVLRSTRFPRSAREGLGSDFKPEPEKESKSFLIVSWIVIAVLVFLFIDEITKQLGA